ncbi:MAG TPA: DUF1801 domain-containing protein [bacterium]|nr:DUF1801 domain-containing protein [bacterium]
MKQATPTVEAYIAQAPAAHRGKLRELRSAIKKAAPTARESISYRIPYYAYKGRLAYFALMKSHIGLYIPPPILQNHKKELKGYSTSRSATLRLPLDKKIPVGLVKKLVKARMKWNESRK